jgi:hypothetical protein
MADETTLTKAVTDAAHGDLKAQRLMAGFYCHQAHQPGGGAMEWWRAEVYARQCATRGEPEDLKQLAGILMAQASMFPDGSDPQMTRQAEALHIADMLAEYGDEASAAGLGTLASAVTPHAIAQAAEWSKQHRLRQDATPDGPALDRTDDTFHVCLLIARNGDAALQFDFDPAAWLSDGSNIALVAGNDLALFHRTAPGVFDAHWLFASRGREALAVGRAASRAMFDQHGAEVIRGLTPVSCPKAAWFNRQLGAKSLGIINHIHGDAELFVLAPGYFQGGTSWVS